MEPEDGHPMTQQEFEQSLAARRARSLSAFYYVILAIVVAAIVFGMVHVVQQDRRDRAEIQRLGR